MDEFLTHIRDGISAFIAAIVAAVVAAIGWIVRTVFTNQKQLEIMRHDIAHRDEQYAKVREDIREVKDDVKTIQSLLMDKK